MGMAELSPMSAPKYKALWEGWACAGHNGNLNLLLSENVHECNPNQIHWEAEGI